MRENMGLFKAKRIDNGEWIQGGIVHQTDYYGSPCDKWFIIDGTTTNDYDIGISEEVDPETVCECTGLQDKNGKLIFENDMFSLVAADGEQITITCKYGTATRQIYENLVEITGFYFERSNDSKKTFPIVKNYLGVHDIQIWERISNTHDNPV